MKKLYLFLTFLVLSVCSLTAQAPERFSYQAVVRDASNHLVTSANVSVRISVLQGSVSGNAIYMETQTANTNANGLITLEIGGGTNQTGNFADINWGFGPYFLKTEIDPNGGNNYSLTSVQQLLSVPYALYSKEAGNGFSGDYNDLTNTPTIPAAQVNSDWNATTGVAEILNKPTIPAVPTNVSAFTNDAGYVTASEIPTVPTNVSAFTNDVPYLTSEQQVLSISNDTIFLTGNSFVKLPATTTGFSGNYSDLVGAPVLATVATSGSYNDLTNTPTIPAAQVNADWNATSGAAEILNKPTIPTVPTNVGDFENNVGYITMDQLNLIMSTMMNSVNARIDSMQALIDSLQAHQPVMPTAAPSVTTSQESGVTDVSATCGGNVTSNGGGVILERGICWSTSPNPTIAGSHIAVGGETGSFTGALTDLTPGTTYYYRAFATNAVGTTYGAEYTFTTAAQLSPLGFRLGNSCVLHNGNCQNYWMTGVVDANDNTEGLFVTNNGVTPGYDKTKPATVMTEILFQTPDLDSIHVEFDLMCGGENTYDYLKAFFCLPSVTFTPGSADFSDVDYSENNAFDFAAFLSQTGEFNHPYKINLTQGNTLHISMNVVNPAPNGQAKLVFLWCNDNGVGTPPGAVITHLIVCDPADAPAVLSVSTSPVTEILDVSAVCGGEVFYDDDAAVTARGVCWSNTSPSPTLSDSHTIDGTGTGVFTSTLTGLTPNTEYYVRAYATNSSGTVYGDVVTFTTMDSIPVVPEGDAQPCPGHATVTDIDGNVYNTVKLGEQCWTKENLRTTRYADGKVIPYGSENSTNEDAVRYYPNNAADNVSTYGYLYSWAAATHGADGSSANPSGLQGICPAGWHLPSLNEWSQLTNYLQGNEVYRCETSSYIGKALCADYGWQTSGNYCVVGNDLSLNNTSGFSMLPAGHCAYGESNQFGTEASFWASSMNYGSPANRNIAYDERSLSSSTFSKSYALSVRCVLGEGLNPAAVTTSGVGSITPNSATCGGEITSDGGSAVTERGICWSLSSQPTVSDHKVSNGAGIGTFTCQMTNLIAGRTYHVRAYAINGMGTAYGEDVPFTTLEEGQQYTLPTVSTIPVSAITATTAMSGCDVSVDGGAEVTECGICWSTSPQPTVNGTHLAAGSGLGYFSAQMTNLSPNTLYYLRAYAINAAGVAYGGEQSFMTLSIAVPTVSTDEVSDIHETWANGHGSVTNDGGSTVTERGICWSTSSNPTINDNHAADANGGVGSFVISMNNLTLGTSYHMRAYAINSSGVGYGEDLVFTTGTTPEVHTLPVSEITTSSAVWHGEVVSDNGYPVTSRGFLWGYAPDLVQNHAGRYEVGSGTGRFSFTRSDLTVNTTYYVVAYATNSMGTAYGDVVSFTTGAFFPYLITSEVAYVQATSAIGGGIVYSDGNATVTERGLCWSTTPNPTIENNHLTAGSGLGGFSIQLSDLEPMTTYHVRAYATNSAGTAYGDDKTFTTKALKPESDGLPCPGHATVTDVDGNVYNTVKIGDQCWMKENLRATHYADGKEIPNRYAPNWDTANVPEYGYLYTWNAMMNGAGSSSANPSGVQGACPQGWHVPSNAEWEQLVNYVLSQPAYFCTVYSQNTIAKALASQTGWNNYDMNCNVGYNPEENNATGFSAMPAGYIVNSSPRSFGQFAYFGSSTSEDNYSQQWYIGYNKRDVLSSSSYSSINSLRCVLGEGAKLAEVVTMTVDEVTDMSVSIRGEVTDDGGANVTARGFCWSEFTDPTLANSSVSEVGGTGEYILQISGLEPASYYYARAYVTNALGTTYGDVISFRTDYSMPEGDAQPCPNMPTVTDVDGNVYNTVKLGNQCWMAENLRTTHFADGQEIPFGLSSSFPIMASRYAPGGDLSLVSQYGYLYNWPAAMKGANNTTANPSGVQGVCPDGWHMPSPAEWTQLTNYLGSYPVYQSNNSSSSYIAKALAANEDWQLNGTAFVVGNDLSKNNRAGFNAYPAGSVSFPNYDEINQDAFFMSTNLSGNVRISYNSQTTHAQTLSASTGISVRCVYGAGNNVATVSTQAAGQITTNSAVCGGNVTADGGANVTARGICWSTSSNPTIANSHTTDGAGLGSFTSTMTGLELNTDYYVRAYATNSVGTVYGSVVMFHTPTDNDEATEYSTPVVTTAPVTNLRAESAMCGGEVISDGGSPVTSRGICWSTSPNPTLSDNQTTNGTGLGSFTSQITGLSVGTTYYVRAYAVNSIGTAYGNEMTFSLQIPAGDGQPCPNAATVTDYDQNVYHTVLIGNQCWMKENLRSTHTADGKAITGLVAPQQVATNVTSYGYLYNWNAVMQGSSSSSANPSGVQGICPTGWHLPSNAEWSQLTNYLESQSAYKCGTVSNAIAKALAAETGWTTYTATCAVGNDLSGNNLTSFSALPAGDEIVGNFGKSAFFWSSTMSEMQGYPYRLAILHHSYDVNQSVNSQTSSLSVRCLQGVGSNAAAVTTAAVTDITDVSATLGGNVLSDGGSAVMERGVCWSTMHNPTIAGEHVSTGTGVGHFTTQVSGLNPTTTYYVRAYAVNAMATSYGAEITFTTATALPVIPEGDGQPCPGAATVTDYDNNVYPTVKIGEQCWMKENLKAAHYANGTEITNRYAPNGNVDAYGYLYSWSAMMNGANSASGKPSGVQGACPAGWHVPSHAEWQQLIDYVKSQGAYRCFGSSSNYAKALAADAGWNTASQTCAVGNDLTQNNATGFSAMPAGYVSNGASTSQFGQISVFWTATLGTPEETNRLFSYNSNGCNSLTYSMDDAYSVRCVRGAGKSLATVVTNTASNITTTSATCGGSVIDDGGANVTERGICWSTSHNPTVNDSRLTNGSGTGSFSSTLTGLSTGTTYYVRAYAVNSLGTIYGNEVTFTAETPTIEPVLSVPTVTTLTVSNITSESATMSGNVTDDGNATVTERGICWSTSHNPTVAGDHIVSGTGMGSFTTSVAGLNAGTTYYVRAYAVNSEGTAYGNEVAFTTLAPTGDGEPCPGMSTLTDYDGNVYHTVKIGEQCWMKENLRTTHYADGAEVTPRQMPAGENANVSVYGYLYKWDVVMHGASATSANPSGVQGICPAGWHVPSDAEWSQLTDYLGGMSTYICGSSNDVAKAMASSNGWKNHYFSCTVGNNQEDNNLSGFSAMPAGSQLFRDFGEGTWFWSTTKDADHAESCWTHSLYFNNASVTRNAYDYRNAFSVRCVRGLGAGVASVNTATVSNITDVSVTCGGNVTADGGATVTERGLCWGTSHHPTTAGSHTASGDGIGEFSMSISGLTPSTIYYVRAYAVNAMGTSYGAEVSFMTLSYSPYAPANDGQPCAGNPTVTDIDSNVYNTVQIGNQCWMKENLRVKHFANAVAIPDGSLAEWPARYNPYGDASLVDTYGYLYNWYAVMNGASSSNVSPSNVQGVCPTGWHVPSDVEWQQMIDYVRSQNAYLCGSSVNNYAKALAANTMWNASTTNCAVGNDLSQNDLTGFSALPAGYRNVGGSFSDAGKNATFWTTSRNGSAAPLNRNIAYNYSNVSRLTTVEGSALSVRCVLGAGASLPEVTTGSVSETTTNTADFSGEVVADGGSAVTVRGVCWSTSNQPTIADSRTSDGSGIGTFTSSLTGLAAGVTYYVRAYATNALGTSYGDEVVFTTAAPADDGMPCPGVTSVRDYDGNYYNTVKIGEQCWLKENMKSLHFADGVAIPDGSLLPASASTPFYYYPGDDATHTAQYGLLYNWSAAMRYQDISNENPSDVQGICPNGWHVPGDAEWQQLIDYVNGMNAYQCNGQDGYIAKALSAATGWMSNYTDCTPGNNIPQNNAIGFTALPAGDIYNYKTSGGSFGSEAEFWSASLGTFRLSGEYPDVFLGHTNSREMAHSVRCIKNPHQMKPTVITVEVDSVMSATATVTGKVSYNGGALVTERGFCWSASTTPTIADNHSVDGSGNGEFTGLLSGLESNTTYYVRAYAMNSEGVAYGSRLKFHTFPAGDLEPCPGAATVTDYDGNVYNTVKLGSQCWMRENLHSTHYADGSAISDYHYFMPNADYVNVYGYHYNWAAVMHGANESNANPSGVQGICPDGWHVPSSDEWYQLTEHLRSSPNYLSKGWSNAIAKSLASSTQWSSSTVNNAVGADYSRNNITGFTAMPAGVYTGNMIEGFYQTARFWSATIHSNAGVASYLLSYDSPFFSLSPCNSEYGASVRCVRGAGVSVPTVSTAEVVRTGNTSVRGKGFVLEDGGSEVTERGFCWSTHPHPSVNSYADHHVSDNYTVISTYIINEMENITADTVYVRAYATNGVGTGYGEEFVIPMKEIVVPKAGTETYVVPNSVSGFHVYDHAGSSANYDILANGSLVLKVNNSLKAFNLYVNSDVENLYDKLYIYDGENSSELIAEISGTNTNLGPFRSSGNTVTLTFVSDNKVQFTGFDVMVKVVAAVPVGDAQPCPGMPTVTDIDQNVYNTVKIGDQCWMKENLRTTRYADNTPIAEGQSVSVSVPYRYTPNVPSQFSQVCGLLYNWAAVMHSAGASEANPSGVQGICPNGWHVPSVAEWNQLSDYVAAHPVYLCNNYPDIFARSLAAGALWTYAGPCTPSGSFSQNNLTGFSILPAGIFYANGYQDLGTTAMFWSTNDNPSGSAFASYMYNNSHLFPTMDQNKANGFSVRCVYGAGNSELPTVTADKVVRTGKTTARCEATVASETEITAKGFCWSTQPNPTLTDASTQFITVESMTGHIEGNLSNLTSNRYYVRAFATNSAGTAYGDAHPIYLTDVVVPKSGTETYEVPSNKYTFHVYDHAGQYDGYDSYCNGQLVVSLDNNLKAFRMSVTGIMENPWDKLSIYEGNGTNQLLAEVTGYHPDAVTFRSTSNTVTLRFASNHAVQNGGFDVRFDVVAAVPAGDAIPCPNAPTVTDVDGNVYNTVKIGNQCWMKENLRTTHYADGSIIPDTIPNGAVSYIYPGRFNPNNDPTRVQDFGRLYNWQAVIHGSAHVMQNPATAQGICPDGWHVPSADEWTQLRTYLNSVGIYRCDGQTDALARALSSQDGWNIQMQYTDACQPNYYMVGNHNYSDFSAMPAGGRNINYIGFFNMATFWSRTTGSDIMNAKAFNIYANDSQIHIEEHEKSDAYSVRCLKD